MRKLIALSLFLFLLLPALIFAQPQLHWLSIEDFSGGLNSDVQSWKIADNECTDILNCYIDDIEQGISKRKGYEKANSTGTTSHNWLQTSAEDFNAGSLVNIDTYTASGTFRLETSYWTQTSASDFASGTLVNIDTTTVSGTFRVTKSTTADVVEQEYATGQDSIKETAIDLGQSFITSEACVCTKIEIYIKIKGSPPDLTVYLKSDDNNSPGEILANATIIAADVGTSLAYVAADIPDTNLTANTRYWIHTAPAYSGDPPEHFYWWGKDITSPGYDRGNAWSDYLGGHMTGVDRLFKVYKQAYESTSSLISQIGDLGIKPDSWGNFEATEDLNGQTIDWYIQTSSSSDMSSPTGWVSVTNNTTPSVTLNQYVQWKSILNASNTTTPVVEDVTINGKIIGSLTSQSHDCTDVVQWGRLEANDTLNGQTITYAVRTSSYSAGLSLADWYEVQSGNNITAPVNQYVQWISTLTSTGSQTPVVNNVTIYWYSTPTSIFDEPITSLHRLKKSDASEYMWAVSSDTIYGSSDANLFASVKSGMSTTYDVNWANIGDSAYAVDGSTWAQKFTAYDSCTAVTTVPRGRFIIEEGWRLWVGYAVGHPNKLYYSDLADDSVWNWVYIPGEGEISGLGKLQGSVIVYKTGSIWKVIGVQVSTEEDVYFVPTLVNLSSEVGCVSHRTIQNFRLKGYTVQLFLGKDNIYATNGVAVVPVGDKIENTIEDLKQATFASSYSWLETNFFDGTSTNVDTTTVLGTVRLKTNYWLETSTTDFNTGVIKTNIAITTDTVSGELGEIKLQITSQKEDQTCYSSGFEGGFEGHKAAMAQSFKPSIDCRLADIILYIYRNGDVQDDLTVYLKKDNYNKPGTTLTSQIVPKEDVPAASFYPGRIDDGFLTVDFDDDPYLKKDTRYWIYIPKIGVFYNEYGWLIDDDNIYTRGSFWLSSGSGDYADFDKFDAKFRFYEQHYPSFGQFRSQEKSLTDSSSLGKFYESHSGSGVTFKVRTYSDNWNAWKIIKNNEDPIELSGSKIQYNIDLTLDDEQITPKVYDVKIEYIGNDGVGTFTSQSHDVGLQITYWGNFIANSILNDQVVSYQVRSSTSADAISNASWYDVISGGLIPALVNRFVQWKATLSTDDGTEIPVVEDVTIFWWAGAFVGSSPTSVIYDDRYHLFAMTSGSDFNDIDLVLNKDGAWVKHDIEASSAIIYDRHFYTGSSTTTAQGSWIYKQDVGYSDDLQPINSYWQSKDYDLGIPYKDKTLRKIWTVTKRVGDYPLNLTYTMDLNRDSESYDINLSQGQTSIIGDEKHIGSWARAKFFNFRVSNEGENQPWELYRIDAGFQPSPGMSEP